MTLTPTPEGYFRADEATGRAMDAVSDGDRLFFERHPDRRLRVRRMKRIERIEFDIVAEDKPFGCRWYVMVEKVSPMARKRRAFWAAPLHRAEQFSEAVCARLFEQLYGAAA